MARQLTLLDPELARWELLDKRARGARFFQLPARTVLNSPSATGMPFWSVNPYVGCEFGCSYCYARDTHRYTLERASASGVLPASLPLLPAAESFERNILVKQNAGALLSRALSGREMATAYLVIGSSTDPYQPAERSFGITRSILEALRSFANLRIEIITKSPLVVRDSALLCQLAQAHDVRVHVSLATIHRLLARRLEVRTATPSARLRALAALRSAGIDAGMLIAPILPGITDSSQDLDALIGAARRADASFVDGSSLRLGPAARRSFIPQLEREFPELAARYHRAYGTQDHPPDAYRTALRERLDMLKARHGFPVGDRQFRAGSTDAAIERPGTGSQLPLL